MNFERKNNHPLDALGIGKRPLIKDWLDEMGVEGYTINDDFTIDIDNRVLFVNLSSKKLKILPDFIQFNNVNAAFYIGDNELESLRGFPRRITSHFSCSGNRLTSLEGCPGYVGGEFRCFENKKQFTEDYVRGLCDVRGKIKNKFKTES